MKNHRTPATAQTPTDLLNDLRTLVTDAEKMATASISERSDEAMGALRERFASAQERCTEIFEGAREKVVAGARYTDESIRANPYQSVGIALGVGVLLGVLIGRRSQ
jgi:ElaB/YqjD/DUF883 family membrane-anchored ribosome-binding protein